MKELPILFSTPMVQAILAFLKGMTRRTRGLERMNLEPNNWKPYDGDVFIDKKGRLNQKFFNLNGHSDHAICPYGKAGDVLWVRETVGKQWRRDSVGGSSTIFIYKANGTELQPGMKWKPSIHMPKDAARIWLQVEEIKVERLHDISEEDAESEGVQWIRRTSGICFMDYVIGEYVFPMTAKNSFKSLWKKINGNDWNIGWDLNPWVWVVKFKTLSTTGKPQMCYKTNEICKYDCKGLCRESM